MKKEIYVCDVCGAERKEANHWFLAEARYEQVTLSKWDEPAKYADNDEKLRDDSSVKHLCGQSCTHKFVDEYMSAKAARVEVNCER